MRAQSQAIGRPAVLGLLVLGLTIGATAPGPASAASAPQGSALSRANLHPTRMRLRVAQQATQDLFARLYGTWSGYAGVRRHIACHHAKSNRYGCRLRWDQGPRRYRGHVVLGAYCSALTHHLFVDERWLIRYRGRLASRGHRRETFINRKFSVPCKVLPTNRRADQARPIKSDRGFYRHCGRPNNWSGRLFAHGVSCHKARGVFNGLQCADSACDQVHSGRWTCFRHTEHRYTYRGNCHLGRKIVRWVLYE